MRKVLLIRLDKIGDLVSTMPVDQIPDLQSSQVTWAISKGLSFIPLQAEPKRNFIELDKTKPRESFFKLYTFLRQNKPDIAVSFQCPWWVSLALFCAGVKVRAGVRSQWHSFIFFNRSLRQKRSQALQHEADYNMDLLAYALKVKTSKPAPILKLQASHDLSPWSLQKDSYVVVHPGMAGSALNWPLHRYIELISILMADTQVVLTGTPADEKWLAPIKAEFNNHPRVMILQNKLKPEELLSVLQGAQVVIAPSTGVLHLAASLGTPTVGLYSPLRVQHPRRWGARGPASVNLLPPEDAIQHDCMEKIKVVDVQKELGKFQ